MLHIERVDVASTADTAIRLIRQHRYALVLCDYNLNHRSDGQQLLEYLREAKLLAPDCLFFMITAESEYGAVAAASEHRPDAYLLKPITAGDIEDRLKVLLDRRNAMQPVTRCLGRGDLAGAVAACDAILARNDRWIMQALMLKGQTLLQMGRPRDAHGVYQRALQVNSDLPWGRLGVARAMMAMGEIDEARRVAEALIRSPEGERNVDAYDVLIACLEQQGDLSGAFGVTRESAAVLPSARRQRMLGEAAYRNGDLDTARGCFAKLAASTQGSLAVQPQDILLHGQTLVDRGEGREAVRVLDDGSRSFAADRQFAAGSQAIRAQVFAQNGDAAAAAAALARARQAVHGVDAGFARIATARAELALGDAEAGLQLLESAISDDHRCARLRQLVGRTLEQTGHAKALPRVVEGGIVRHKVQVARKLFNESRGSEAAAMIESLLDDYPRNTEVLLQAAQMNCLILRNDGHLDSGRVDRVSGYLQRLEELMPGSDRVAHMRRYYRDTVCELEGGRRLQQST